MTDRVWFSVIQFRTVTFPMSCQPLEKIGDGWGGESCGQAGTVL